MFLLILLLILTVGGGGVLQSLLRTLWRGAEEQKQRPIEINLWGLGIRVRFSIGNGESILSIGALNPAP